MMRTTLLVTTLLAVAGCASMNESECRNGDWRMIGFEDGSAGHARSQIGAHREACAKQDITPDLDAYTLGHAEGLLQFCTENNGYRVGHSGAEYSGVCPGDVEEGFLLGYRSGRELHAAEQAVQQARAAVAGYAQQIRTAQETLTTKEEWLISDESTEESRRQLLAEIKALREELTDLERALHRAEHQVAPAEHALESLQRSIFPCSSRAPMTHIAANARI